VLAIVSLLAILTISVVITRVATVMLTATGLSREIARFQARSAFSGAGFTTNESESVVNHPVRRRIVLQLMLVGAAGVVTSLTTLLLSFTDASEGEAANRILVLLGGLAALYLFTRSRVVDLALTRVTEWALRRYTRLNVRDYDKLLHISEEYAIVELDVRDDTWLAARPLQELDLRAEGVIVLGLYQRHGSYLGVPRPSVQPTPGDRLVLYGEDDNLAALATRPAGVAGDELHAQAVARYSTCG
jgi:hypothetical protein